MVRYGFTGTRNGMTAEQLNWLRAQLPDRVEFHHGGCVGADAQAHACAIESVGSIVVHPPVNPRLRMPRDGRAAWLEEKEYLDRDRDIVDATDLLLATPDGPERQKSGTWYTVRYAEKAGKPVRICYPDGTTETR